MSIFDPRIDYLIHEEWLVDRGWKKFPLSDRVTYTFYAADANGNCIQRFHITKFPESNYYFHLTWALGKDENTREISTTTELIFCLKKWLVFLGRWPEFEPIINKW